MVDFMDRVLMAQVQNANAQIAKHKINVEVLTKNASGTAAVSYTHLTLPTKA